MTPISGWLNPEARATFDAVFAKLAAPGMCNAADDEPCLSGTPSQAAIAADTRSLGQRQHDALLAAARALLASGELGQHNGLPASIIVTTTLQELEAGAGRGLTGGGTLLPMSDVIRLGSHAHHYLAIFDNGKALALYHTKRLASPAQRIVLYATRSRLHLPRLHHARPTSAKSTTTTPTPPTPSPTSTTSAWPAAPTTTSPNKAGPPAKTPTATPNGSHHHTSTEANPAPTPTTTPKNCSRMTTKRRQKTVSRLPRSSPGR